jgi:hypothetical protein
MRRPRSRSAKSCRTAFTTAEATTAVARIDSGAAPTPRRIDSVMGSSLGERKKAEPPGALLQTAATQTLSGPALPLSSPPTKWGPAPRADPRVPVTNADSPSRRATRCYSAASNCCSRSSSVAASRSSSSERNSGNGPASPSSSGGSDASTKRSASGNQPDPSRRRSASLAVNRRWNGTLHRRPRGTPLIGELCW